MSIKSKSDNLLRRGSQVVLANFDIYYPDFDGLNLSYDSRFIHRAASDPGIMAEINRIIRDQIEEAIRLRVGNHTRRLYHVGGRDRGRVASQFTIESSTSFEIGIGSIEIKNGIITVDIKSLLVLGALIGGIPKALDLTYSFVVDYSALRSSIELLQDDLKGGLDIFYRSTAQENSTCEVAFPDPEMVADEIKRYIKEQNKK